MKDKSSRANFYDLPEVEFTHALSTLPLVGED
jgi:hypothetical protein